QSWVTKVRKAFMLRDPRVGKRSVTGPTTLYLVRGPHAREESASLCLLHLDGERGHHRLRAGQRAYLHRHADEVQPEAKALLPRAYRGADAAVWVRLPRRLHDDAVLGLPAELVEAQRGAALLVHHVRPALGRASLAVLGRQREGQQPGRLAGEHLPGGLPGR